MTFPDGIEALIGHPNDYYDLVLCEGELLKAVDDGYDINTFGNRTACTEPSTREGVEALLLIGPRGRIISQANIGKLGLKGESPSLVNNGQEPFWTVVEVRIFIVGSEEVKTQ
ncbi:uncharacterized protein FTOL_05040 [Fusarium torulosum]|uniref:Uncharacterized protein n=1 Tax=Fusarium torulosum TaxID=33205 RepID=A0AAE8M6Z4_9HYPO|nr:uncharacterized protein FTOL_05040 [Fusarium torulosum]